MGKLPNYILNKYICNRSTLNTWSQCFRPQKAFKPNLKWEGGGGGRSNVWRKTNWVFRCLYCGRVVRCRRELFLQNLETKQKNSETAIWTNECEWRKFNLWIHLTNLVPRNLQNPRFFNGGCQTVSIRRGKSTRLR